MAGKTLSVPRYYRDQAPNIVRLGVLSLVSAQAQAAALVLVVPLAQSIAKNRDTYAGRLGPVHFSSSTTTLALFAAVAIVVAGITDISIAWVRSRVMSTWELGRREQVIAEFLKSDYPTQAGERLGTLGLLTGYVNRGSAALGAIVNGLEAVVTISLFLVMAMLLNFLASLFLIFVVLFLSLLLRPVMLRTKRYAQASSAMLIDYGRDVTETTRMVRDVRVFHALDAIGARLTRQSRRLAHVRQRAAFVNGLTSPVYQYAGMLLLVGALAGVSKMQGVRVEEFGGIALLLLRSLTFGQQLQNSYQAVVDAKPYLEKLEEQRDAYAEHVTHDGTVVLETVHRLDLQDLRYSYDGETDALAGITIGFNRGQIVGIVGPSGSGKSTLSQLLMRLRDPTGGDILVNRTPAGDYTLASWYRRISLVPQDPRLLHATVYENIAFLDPAISREQVVEAAKAASVHDVIESLEHGYDTLIGPAFRDLSGGQIQRIGIARALARGADVLVLDEPTSALDVHSEAMIQATLESLRGRGLVLIIAHRLSTLSICDGIVVMRNGRIETAGTLQEVTERSDFFRRALDAGTLEIGTADATPAVPDDV
jgi:ABC-type multidrug transport system fused ATPase/permease subunit